MIAIRYTGAIVKARQRSPEISLCLVEKSAPAWPKRHGSAIRDCPLFHYSLYLLSIPNNPFTDSNKVSDGAVGSSDWYYNEKAGEFRANDKHTGL